MFIVLYQVENVLRFNDTFFWYHSQKTSKQTFYQKYLYALKEFLLIIILIGRSQWGAWKITASESHQSKSPRSVKWMTCHVIGASSLDAESTTLQGNTDSYHGNRDRYQGYHGLTGSQLEGNMALPPAGEGGRACSTVPPAGGVV